MEMNPLPEAVTDRYAAVYIRQSDPTQVLKNQGSTEWQRNLKQLAERRGWEPARVVLFADLGVAATPGSERPEFQALLNFIGTGQVGMIFVVDGSRLARNEMDWATMVDVCALTKTWICVDEQISDPNNHSHRFRLGLNATITQVSGQLLRTRLSRGAHRKAAKGQLWMQVPIGYEHYNSATVMAADPAIRSAIQQVFTLFDEIGTAIGVARYYNQRQLTLPSRRNGGQAEIVWVEPTNNAIQRIIKNPKYAGAYAWGRSQTQVDKVLTEGGRLRCIIRHVVHQNPLHWSTLLHDAHPGYITWKQYEKNQERLKNNKFGLGNGSVREGKALLQGLVRCGICGSGMTVAYQSAGEPTYRCDWGKRKKGTKLCQCLIGPTVERAVVHAVLSALTPAQIDVALEVQHRLPEQQRREQKARSQQRDQLMSATRQAKAQYLAAADRGLDKHLLSELERDWCVAREAEMTAQKMFDSEAAREEPLANADVKNLDHLTVQFSELWNRAGITNEVKKELIRSLIQRVTLRKDKEGRKIYIVIAWHSDASTSLVLTDEQYRFDPSVPRSVIDQIRQLSKTKTGKETADYLNAQGILTGAGRKFSTYGVNFLRKAHNIKIGELDDNFSHYPSEDMYSNIELQKLLNIDREAVKAWCKEWLIGGDQNAFGYEERYYVTKTQMGEMLPLIEERRYLPPTPLDIDSFNTQRMNDSTWNKISSCFRHGNPVQSRIILDGLIWAFKNKRNWSRVPPTMPHRKICIDKLKLWRANGDLQRALEQLHQVNGDDAIQDLIEFLKYSGVGSRSFCGEFPPRDPSAFRKRAKALREQSSNL